jgi:hypothetical protein
MNNEEDIWLYTEFPTQNCDWRAGPMNVALAKQLPVAFAIEQAAREPFAPRS